MNKSILLIEDNAAMRENISEILQLSNYSVTVAENGKVGIEQTRNKKFDLIICDIMMPELDGYGVLHILSKNDDTAGIPFIFLTAKTEKNDFRKGMTLGADDYLTKPFDDLELLDAIEIRLKRAELLKKEFQKGAKGFDDFIENVNGINGSPVFSDRKALKTFKKKEGVFSEGNYPANLYLVNKGKVKTFKTNTDGKELITGIHTEGSFIGYSALMELTAYSESAVTLEDAEIYAIPRQDFFSLIYNNREVSKTFIKMLSNNLAESEERLIRLAYNSVRKRVAESLVMLEEKYRDPKNPETIIPISRENLANIVGTATESCIRTLGDFKEEKLIDVRKGEIFILNISKLKGMKN